MIDYSNLYTSLKNSAAAAWLDTLPDAVYRAFNQPRHGDMDSWLAMMDRLPPIEPSAVDLLDSVSIGTAADCSDETRSQLEQDLRILHPWRKGPFNLFGIHIDTEWHSDWKWDRLKHGIDLQGKMVLDIGCGNGYYALRMFGAGAKRVIGIDPGQKYVMQFYSMKKYLGDIPVDVLPLGIENVPVGLRAFDTVFSMGVLYHRRSPLDHLLELRETLKPGGELVLETLVIEGDETSVLLPEDRYQQMRNVWFLPSVPALSLWLRRSGFSDIRVVNVSPTTTAEQRKTDWMQFQSLQDFVHPDDSTKTIEGYPGPVRAVLVARAD